MQQKPTPKVMMYGLATVVLLMIVGIVLSALSRSGDNNAPNSTQAMANTSEPTNTPKLTVTEIPGPIVLSVHEAQQALDNESTKGFYAFATEQYTVDELTVFSDSNEPIPLTLTNSIPLQLGYIYCAKTQAILEDNLQSIVYTFRLRGNTIPESNYGSYNYTTEDSDGNPFVCQGTYIIIDGWVMGQYPVYQEVDQIETINNGYQDIEAVNLWHEYVVTVP